MRIRNTVSRLQEESHDVLVFTLECLHEDKNSRELMCDIFEAYQMWRFKHNLPLTVLNDDGFGRLFPKTFQRKKMCKNGIIARGVVGVRLK